MKLLIYTIIFFLFLQSIFSQNCTISSVQDGTWVTPTTWTPSQTLNCDLRQQSIVICIYHNVTVDCDLSLGGGVQIFLMSPGVTLTINGDFSMNGATVSGIPNGSQVIINGNVNLSGNSEINLDGGMTVNGNFGISGNGVNLNIDGTLDVNGDFIGLSNNVCGSGVLTVTGTITGSSNCLGNLSVKLGFFKTIYNNNFITIKWETESETNNSHFLIEKSFDGSSFYDLSIINGHGNILSPAQYSYNDYDIIHNQTWVYYRLKQVDYDGNYMYSSIISTELSQNKNDKIKIYPNPISDDIYLIGVSDEISYSVINCFGQTVQNGKIINNHIKLNDLSCGNYVLIIPSNKKNSIIKFCKN